jgi:hypothetical protein
MIIDYSHTDVIYKIMVSKLTVMTLPAERIFPNLSYTASVSSSKLISNIATELDQ